MAIVGSPELTAAVSNAGGVGLFCMGPGAPEMLADQIDSIRRLSSAPFGVDFIVEETGFGPATTEAHIEVAIGKHVPLAVFFWNPPEERWISKLKRAGIKVWGTAYSVESARRLKALGADAVIVQSQEAGGHVKSDLGAMALVPAVVDALGRIPVIAAGGIADGRTAAAAFMLGAQAVCVGTRLVASAESLASDEYKQGRHTPRRLARLPCLEGSRKCQIKNDGSMRSSTFSGCRATRHIGITLESWLSEARRSNRSMGPCDHG
jgi:enoyl-[acyl-carrier protein] reductase II